MAEGGGNPTKTTRTLQEALVGKIPEENAYENLTQVEWNLDYAADLSLSQDHWPGITSLSREEVLHDLHSKFENKTETRQFACGTCDRYWWRRVPARKPVSKCRRCNSKYDAVPRNKEWGWCKYVCEKCGHEFSGFGSMGNPAESPCYTCGSQCFPAEVSPSKKRNRDRRTPNTHSCNAENCCNHSGGYSRGYCPHPKSRAQKVLFASTPHVSTGSTVNTFLSQGSLERFDTELSDVDEEP